MPDALTVSPSDAPALEIPCDALLVPVSRDGETSETFRRIDESLEGLLSQMRDTGEFRGEAHEVVVVPTLGRLTPARIALVGLGKGSEHTPHTRRQVAAAACRTLGKRRLRNLGTHAADWPGDPEEVGVLLAEGAELSRYISDPYRTGERTDNRVVRLTVGGASKEALREGSIRGRAKNLARDLVNEPSNVLDPPELARRAVEMAERVGLEHEVLEEADMETLGMGAILTVCKGSDTPGELIILRHRPEGVAEGGPVLALVGKAVTFDTGGISIKPAAEMGRMKGDMAGGAAVIGAMQAIAELNVPLEVIALVPAVDNMPSGKAWKPGDVVTAMSGKTIETISTDAEGRMLLADAVHYARQLGATHIVDIATLTGACVVALGHVASGLYGTDAEWTEAVRAAGEAAGERHWPMPLFPEYRELIRSEIADLKNSGGRTAGSITAAWFIREFAGDTPWAHLDIAGSSTYEKGKPYAPAGPTGTGVGTFINLALSLAGSHGGD